MLRLSRYFYFTSLASVAISTHAWAASFHVNPVVLSLSRSAPTTQLEIENESDDTVRFQVSTYAWDQTPTNELVLTPTAIVITFPTLFSIEPHQKRIMRLGMKHPPGAGEETYRVVVEELGPLRKSDAPPSSGLKVLTRMSMPLFTEVDKPKASAALKGASVKGGLLAWDTQNTGNVHIVAHSVHVVARDAAGAVVFEEAHKAWYVLRGHTHHSELQIPVESCKKISSIELQLDADGLKAGATITVTPQQCSG